MKAIFAASATIVSMAALTHAAPQAPIPIRGIVVGSDGKPAAGAEVTLMDWDMGFPVMTTDDQGRFAFGPAIVRDDMRLFAKMGDLGVRTGVTPPASGAVVTLHLAPKAFCIIQGQVSGQDGETLAHAKVDLMRWNKSHGDTTIATTTTDESGRYSFASLYGDSNYIIEAHVSGYATKYVGPLPAVAGKTLDVAAIGLAKTDSFAGGVVHDPNGKPIAGAKVQDYDIASAKAVTDRNGRFRLEGVARDKSIVRVDAPEARYASVLIVSGRDDNEITVKSEKETEDASRRLSAQLAADRTNHGDGSDAHTLLNAAQRKAGAEGKSVLLVFHATWCKPCFLLHQFLEDPKVKPILGAHFVVLDLDIWEKDDKKKWENSGGAKLYQKYSGPNSIPYSVILDANGRKLADSIRGGENVGLPTDARGRAFLLNTFKKAQPTLTAANIETLNSALKRRGSL